MNKIPSFEKINYMLRPGKQVERKMIIDLLSRLNLELPIAIYQYIGMGSIYYYDFILIHKYFGITKMVSIDNKNCYNRFLFNKPYDFVEFENCDTSDYLFRHNFNLNSLFWLDYDGHISGNDFLKRDISILGKNCKEGDLYFVTINCETPKSNIDKQKFLDEFHRYIPTGLNHIRNVVPGVFPRVVQEVLLNMIAESCLYNSNKFLKICSFQYKDGALMYTLGGIFTQTTSRIKNTIKNNELFQFERDKIFEIKIPNLTYKEKFYLDSNVTLIDDLIKYSKEYWLNKSTDTDSFEDNINGTLAKELEFELSYSDLSNYIKNYRFIPQYYEGII